MSRSWRTWLAFTHDLAAVALAWLTAFWLRFNFEIPGDFLSLAIRTLPWVVAVHAPIGVRNILAEIGWRGRGVDVLMFVLALTLAMWGLRAVWAVVS